MEYPDQLDDFCKQVEPVGSRVTCNPPPTDTDLDLLCLVTEEDYETLTNWLNLKGWVYDDAYPRMTGDFESWRKHEYNAIVTSDEDFFSKFMKATAICKEKNLLKKEERIAQFEEVMGKKKSRSLLYSDLDDLVAGTEAANPALVGVNAAQQVFPWQQWTVQGNIFPLEHPMQHLAQPVEPEAPGAAAMAALGAFHVGQW